MTEHLGGTYRAEQGLLASLNKPRKKTEKMIPGKRSLAPQSVKTMIVDGQEVPIDLKMFRIPKGEDKERKADELVAEVHNLHHKDLRSESQAPASNYKKITDNAEDRRHRHDAAMKNYDETLKYIADQLEEKVVAVGTAVRELLGELDHEITKVFDDLQNDELLSQQPSHAYVVETWKQINTLCAKRTAAIQSFADDLEGIEQERGQIVGAELRTLADTMVATAYKLPPEIERIVEVEVYELNLVLIGNRRSNADLISRLKKKDVDSFVKSRTMWLRSEAHWRTLRHDRAVRIFQETIGSELYTNPEVRQDIFSEMRAAQQDRHNTKRVVVLQKLLSLQPDELSSTAVDGILKEFNAVYEEDEQSNGDYFNLLLQKHNDMLASAKTLREELRAELHTYGALAPEGNLVEHSERLLELLANPELEDWFRMSGGLKPTLTDIMKTLKSPSLIYNDKLLLLKEKVQLLVHALPLGDVLEEQGKSGDRATLMSTLEQVRKAAKSDLPALLPIVLKQARVFVNVSGLHPMLTDEFKAVVAGFEKLEQDNIREQAAYEKTLKKSSKGKKTDFAAELGLDTVKLDMVSMRKWQRKLGMMLYACDLSEGTDGFKHRLKLTLKSLKKQKIANDVVDEVVMQESVDPMLSRENESKSLLDKVGRALGNQSDNLHAGCKALCGYYSGVAKMLERHAKEDEKVDTKSLHSLDSLRWDHRERLGRDPADEDDFYPDENEPGLWEQQRAILDHLRHAPDEKTLEQQMEKALEKLAEIESEYRAYHKEAMSMALTHPQDANSENRRYFREFGLLFNLMPPKQIHPNGFEHELEWGADGAPPPKPEPVKEPEYELDEEGNQVLDEEGNPVLKVREEEAAPEPEVEQEEDDGEPKTDPWEGVETLETPMGLEYGIQRTVDQYMFGEAAAEPAEGEEGEGAEAKPTVPSIIPADKPLDYVEPEEDEKEEEEEEEPEYELDEDGNPVLDEEGNPVLKPKEEEEAGEEAEPEADEEEAEPEYELDEDGNPVLDEEGNPVLKPKEEEPEEEEIEIIPEDPVPKDPNGTVCMQLIAMPRSAICEHVERLRGELILRNEKRTKKRLDAVSELCTERREQFTNELEERLRVHWPRKGRTDVSYMQPRKGELNNHEQRHYRHVRETMLKNEAQAAEFEKELADSKKHSEKYLIAQHTGQASLPLQSNLAALQGVEGKAKQARAAYRMEAEEWRAKLMVLARDCPKQLVRGNENLVANARASTFDQGGDYNEQEIGLLKDLMDQTSDRLAKTISEREQAVAQLHEEQEAALALAARFKERYESCLQDLCMRDGLGQKYGAPRRNAQERLRTEVARSDMASERIDNLLVLLRQLCASAMGEAGGVDESRSKKANRSFWSMRIRRCLIELRNVIYRRAQYLQFLKRKEAAAAEGDEEPEEGPLLLDEASCLVDIPADFEIQGCTYAVNFDDGSRDPSVPADNLRELLADGAEASGLKAGARVEARLRGGDEFLPGKIKKLNKDGDGGDPKDEVLSSANFLEVVTSLEEKCKEDTRVLYAAEGKEDELAGGVPEALQQYLDEQRERAAMHEEAASRKLREQTAELQELLIQAPAAALTDMLRRARERASKTREAREGAFAGVAAELDAAKQKNKALLKPQLSDLNKAAELEALCDAEAARTEKAQGVIAEVKTELLEAEQAHAADLEKRFVAICKAFGVILDSTPRVTDLGWLPGDDDIVPKRKCLKRLRLQKRKKVKKAAAEAGGEGAVPRFEVRTWKPIANFGELTIASVTKESARLESARRAGAEEEAGDEETAAAAGAGAEEGEGEDGAAEDAGSANSSLTTMVTTAHRQFIKARNAKYEEYKQYFFKRMMQTDEDYNAILKEEQAWAGNWSTMVEFLKKGDDEDGE